jgi:hypothetical protein
MRNFSLLLLALLSFSSVHAQLNENEKFIEQKWKYDTDLMKIVFKEILKANPNTANLDATKLEANIQKLINQIAEDVTEYKLDGTLFTKRKDINLTGNWHFSDDNQYLVSKTADEPEKKFKIVELSKSKLHLQTEKNVEIFLIPSK